jgi:hypothetical protein
MVRDPRDVLVDVGDPLAAAGLLIIMIGATG